MNPLNESDLLSCAIEAAHAAGRHALDNFSRRTEVHRTLDHDVKLQLDLECQAAAEAAVRRRFPGHRLLGEESTDHALTDEFQWIIDPLDGTVNFTHGLPLWCNSIAVRRGGRTLAGAIFAPMMGELYTATASGPALLNGQPMAVSPATAAADGIVYSGILRDRQDGCVSLNVMNRMASAFQKVRLLGSAALELCYVACGRGEGYLETNIHLWDVAAGELIVERAGGRCEVLGRHSPVCMQFMASNGRIHDEFRAAVMPVLAPARLGA